MNLARAVQGSRMGPSIALGRAAVTFGWVLGLASLLACAKSGGESAPDSGLGRRSRCVVDDHRTPEKAASISVNGMRFPEDVFLCPFGATQWYVFDLPPNNPILTVDLAFDAAAASAVQLAYDIIPKSQTSSRAVASVVDTMTNRHSRLHGLHFLGAQGGRYLLRVHAATLEQQDDRNPYRLTLTAGRDLDTHEPDEDCAHATRITDTDQGTIGFHGDKDAYVFNVPAGSKVIDARFAIARPSPVNLLVSLYPSGSDKLLTKALNPRGSAGPTDLRIRHGLLSIGRDYCMILEDKDGTNADPTNPYTITLAIVPEADRNETVTRNDTPSTATQVIDARTTFTGKIYSIGDLDWYRVRGSVGRIVEIDLSCPGCTFTPAVSFVYGHRQSSCSEESICDYLINQASPACNLDTDCPGGICRQTPGGKHCGLTCGNDLDCASFTCQRTAGVQACAAVGSCTAENLCGMLKYNVIAGPDGSVKTAQPLLDDMLYILVHDSGDQRWGEQDYRLTITVTPDPDTNEPNNFYEPYRMLPNVPGNLAEEILRRSRDLATKVNWQPLGDGRFRVSGRGCISYEGDIDVFQLVGGNPCTIATSTATPRPDAGVDIPNCGLQLAYDRPGGPVDIAYALTNSSFGQKASFALSGTGNKTVFGDAVCHMGPPECILYEGTDRGDYFLVIRGLGQNSWDTSASHCYNWSITSAADSGCPESCPTRFGGNGRCTCM